MANGAPLGTARAGVGGGCGRMVAQRKWRPKLRSRSLRRCEVRDPFLPEWDGGLREAGEGSLSAEEAARTYEMGFRARWERGVELCDCPYFEGTGFGRSWVRGWKRANRLVRHG